MKGKSGNACYLIVCPLVFLAGLVDSIAGGGGIISLPAYMLAGVPAHSALGTNKMGSTMGTIVSTLRYAGHGYLKGKVLMAACSAAMAMAGSSIGSHIALIVPDSVIRHMMLVVLPIVAAYVLFNKGMGDNEKTGTVPKQKVFVISLAAALLIGAYDGFYGPGTGTFLLLVLTGAARMDVRSASAQTKVINLSSNVAALVTFLINGNVVLPLDWLPGSAPPSQATTSAPAGGPRRTENRPPGGPGGIGGIVYQGFERKLNLRRCAKGKDGRIRL